MVTSDTVLFANGGNGWYDAEQTKWRLLRLFPSAGAALRFCDEHLPAETFILEQRTYAEWERIAERHGTTLWLTPDFAAYTVEE